ncbi:MAG: ATP-binding protein [Desulfomonilaceae bacterium]|nr:ATP-binding protein [Desulfomonilaceae bacterium]
MDTRHFQALRARMIVTILCFALLPLFGVGLTVYYKFSEAYWNKIEEGALSLVENRKDALEMFLRERIAQLVTLTHTQSLTHLKDEAYLAGVFALMQSRSKSLIDIGIIDDKGDHVAYVGPHYERLKTVNYSEAHWFHAVMSSGTYISDVFLGFRRVPHFIIAVTTIQDNRTWVLRATINSDIIENIVKRGQVGKRGDAFLINKKDVLQTPSRLSGKILTRPDAPNFSDTIATTVERNEYRGKDLVFAVSPLEEPKWVLVIEQDPKEMLAPIFGAKYISVLVVASGVLIVLVGTIVTTRSMTNELIRVQREKAANEEVLLQSSKMAALGKMAAGIAHEINNPLQVISEKAGWMHDLLSKEDLKASPDFEEFEDCVKKIDRQVERCRHVTHRMLRFGRRMDPTQEITDINHILRETVTFLENEAYNRDIELSITYDHDLPAVTTDASQLQQVLLNVIDNAIDAVGNGGKITLQTGSKNGTDGRSVFVVIADNGPGIPKDVLKQIFDPLFTTKAVNKGTGLGLSISHSIMEKLGGRITVDSELGRGTTFTIYLPLP